MLKSFNKFVQNLSFRLSCLIGLGLVFVVYVMIYLYAFASKQLYPELFRPYKTISWKEESGKIYRFAARGDMDSTLLSVDAFESFDFEVTIENPRECGIVLGFEEGSSGFYFVLINQSQNRVAWLRNEGGKVTPLSVGPLPPLQSATYRIQKETDGGILYINGQRVLAAKLPDSVGKIGFLLREANDPKTTFSNISLNGKRANGSTIHIDSSRTIPHGFWLFVFVLILLSVGLGLLAVYLSLLAQKFMQSQTSRLDEDKGFGFLTAGVVHFILTALIFYPFVLKGHVLVSSSDNFEQILPLLYISKWQFLDIIRGVSWGLWNPYLHNGAPFFSSHWDMVYYPLNWPFFLLPDKLFLFGITLRQFLEIFLMGVFAYGFFAQELKSKSWALLCSVAFQLCSDLIFANSVFPATSLIFSASMYLYFVWSMHTRSAKWNYILITASVVCMLTTANVAFVFYVGLILTAISLYRFRQLAKEDNSPREIKIILAAVITGLLMAMIRFLPAVMGPFDSYRVHGILGTIQDRWPLVTRLFLPEIVGAGLDAYNPMRSRGLTELFGNTATSQIAFLMYFGIVPLALLFASLFVKAEGRHRFWRVLGFLVLAIGLWVQPFFGFAHLLTFPVKHAHYLIVILPLGMCALFGFTGKYILSNKEEFYPLIKKICIGFLIMQAFVLTFLAYVFPEALSLLRKVALLLLLWCGLYGIFGVCLRNLKEKFFLISGTIGEILLLSATFLVGSAIFIRPIPYKESLAAFGLLPCLFLLITILLSTRVFKFLNASKTSLFEKISLLAVVPAAILLTTVLFLSPLIKTFLTSDLAFQIYFSDLFFGQIKSIALVLLALNILVFIQKGMVHKNLGMALLIFITAVDLVAFNLRFDNVMAPAGSDHKAFHERVFPYQISYEDTINNLDLENYRVSHHNRIGFKSNEGVVYKLRSYTGTTGYITKRFADFIRNFGYSKSTTFISPLDSTNNERFLDLSGVKYAFIDHQNVFQRPTALPRLSLYHNYEVHEQRENLFARLNDPSFNPKMAIILNEHPETIFTRPGRIAEFVSMQKHTTDRVEATVTTNEPALLFFNDSYHKGWKAYIDGKPTKVYPANHNFMACLVPAGSHEVQFIFKPKLFTLALMISLCGTALFFALIFTRKFINN